MRIAKMANLYQYCTSSEGNRFLAKTWTEANSDQQTIDRNDIFVRAGYWISKVNGIEF